jgi:hypothetical protein
MPTHYCRARYLSQTSEAVVTAEPEQGAGALEQAGRAGCGPQERDTHHRWTSSSRTGSPPGVYRFAGALSNAYLW